MRISDELHRSEMTEFCTTTATCTSHTCNAVVHLRREKLLGYQGVMQVSHGSCVRRAEDPKSMCVTGWS